MTRDEIIEQCVQMIRAALRENCWLEDGDEASEKLIADIRAIGAQSAALKVPE